MRIRKRFPPPPSLPSDPQLIHNSLLVGVQQQQEGQQAKTNSQPFDPSDQSHLTHPSTSNDQEPVIKLAQEKLVELGEIGVNHTRKEGIQGAKTSHEGVLSVPPSSSSHQVFGGWYGEDRVIPIKKRRGSLGKSANDEGLTTKKEERTMGKTMKSKTNKKCVQENGEEQEHGKESLTISKLEGIDQMINNGADAKKNIVKRGSVIMEGSRCSRVNGRGWRCCQQTLVGYSLCEHHLGKGRLRSMISVRNRAKTKKGAQVRETKSKMTLVHNTEPNDDEENDAIRDDDFIILQRKQKMKMKKIGMVKARSISSLLRLGQTDSGTTTEVTVDENDKN